MSLRINPRNRSFSYYFSGERHQITCADYKAAADAANMLLLENYKSVSARYPGESSLGFPGPIGGVDPITSADVARYVVDVNPVQVFKTIDCYSYQSCEHDGWKSSEAHAFCESLRNAACKVVIGYEDAVWGAPSSRK